MNYELRISGEVIHGDGVGKRLGYPTANLDIKKEKIKLSPGVYAARAVLNTKKYNASLVIQEKIFKVEVHLLDYTGEDFYGAYLEVEPVEKVSKIVPFKSEGELIKKIAEDTKKVKLLLNIPIY
ncbi:MAG: riboflavin kinase [Candidatus Magasanikbacteria bacterium]|nr:riboflavin kinase [Candidatus Magasanikbacteria bacterium]